MQLTINGSARNIPDGTRLQQLLEEQLPSTRGSAAAVDGEVVPRSEWPAFRLRDGHTVELITAVQGG